MTDNNGNSKTSQQNNQKKPATTEYVKKERAPQVNEKKSNRKT